MSLAIGLGDAESQALYVLNGYRSFNKAGLAICATTNTYTVTLGGTVQTGDTVTVNVLTEAGLVTGSFEITATEDTLAKAATALELVVEALTGVSSSAADAVITITPATTTQAIVVTAAVTGTDPTTTVTVAETVVGSKGYKTANTLFYTLDGHAGSKAATNNLTFTGVNPIGPSSFRWYLVTIGSGADGTLYATPAPEDGVNILPDIPVVDGYITTVVGAIKIATAAATTFTPNTTSLNATGITDTYYDLSVIPKAGYPA